MAMIWLILASILTFLASSGAAYLWWVKVREMRLRQDIFAIRDDLFDLAVNQAWLDDPAYQAFRKHLNTLLALAHHLSVPTLIHLSELPVKKAEFPRSENNKLQEELDRCMAKVAARIVNYIQQETLIGILLCLAQRMVNWAKPAQDQQISERIAPGHLPINLNSLPV